MPGAKQVDYAAIARASGYPAAHNFAELEDFTRELPAILAAQGPVFVALKVLPEVENTPIGQRVRWRTRSADKVVADLRAALGTCDQSFSPVEIWCFVGSGQRVDGGPNDRPP